MAITARHGIVTIDRLPLILPVCQSPPPYLLDFGIRRTEQLDVAVADGVAVLQQGAKAALLVRELDKRVSWNICLSIETDLPGLED